MKIVAVASANPVKLQAVREGFARLFPGESFEVRAVPAPSGVADQPMTSREGLLGARNRAEGARRIMPEADYWVGVEGAVELEPEGDLTDGLMSVFAWIVVTDGRMEGKGRSGTFFLPPKVAELVCAGKELGEADDIVFGRSNSKQENGAVGILTDDVIDRVGFYAPAVVLALIPFKNPQLY